MGQVLVAILNHKPLPEQVSELKAMGYNTIIHIPHPQIPPNYNMEEVLEFLHKFTEIIAEELAKLSEFWLVPDAIWCQGDFRLFYALTQYCIAIKIPLYIATTERKAEEQVMSDGSVKKVSVFRHVKFVRVV